MFHRNMINSIGNWVVVVIVVVIVIVINIVVIVYS